MNESLAYRIGIEDARRAIDTMGLCAARWRSDRLVDKAHRVAAIALREAPLQSGVEPEVYECQATADERAAYEAADAASRVGVQTAIGQRLLNARLGATWAAEYEAGWRAVYRGNRGRGRVMSESRYHVLYYTHGPRGRETLWYARKAPGASRGGG